MLGINLRILSRRREWHHKYCDVAPTERAFDRRELVGLHFRMGLVTKKVRDLRYSANGSSSSSQLLTAKTSMVCRPASLRPRIMA